ncbi:hypothetical protein CVS51_20210 [Ralstonia solanacearum]|nr:hypothetical protein CVS51_20210 [Ralstonia solanacearum]
MLIPFVECVVSRPRRCPCRHRHASGTADGVGAPFSAHAFWHSTRGAASAPRQCSSCADAAIGRPESVALAGAWATAARAAVRETLIYQSQPSSLTQLRPL